MGGGEHAGRGERRFLVGVPHGVFEAENARAKGGAREGRAAGKGLVGVQLA